MNSKRNTLWAAIAAASVTLASGAVTAQDEFGFEDESAPAAKPRYENYLELGVGHTEDGNGKFGEYGSGVNGAFQTDGPFGVAGLSWGSVDADSATEWQVNAGTGGGRSLEASYGIQGNFNLGLYGDRLEKVEYHKAGSMYQGGGDTLLLPAGFVPGTSVRNGAFYTEENIATTRQVFGIDGVKHLAEHWTLSFNVENQDKDGDDTLGGNQGFSGTALIPEPIDYSTDQMTARAEYASRCLQTGLELYVSQFENGNDKVSFQNAQIVTSPVLTEIGLEPDNEFMRIGLDGGYSLDLKTRLSWFADFSRGEQDDDFVPLQTGPLFAETSLDGEVERTSMKLALVGRPFARFDYRLQADYRQRDATHDAFAPNVASTTSNHVYDKETQSVAIEGGYRFANRFRIRGGYELESIDRDTDGYEATVFESFTDSTDEDHYWLELKLPDMGSLAVKLRAEYNTLDPELSNETEEFISPGGVARRATAVFLLERSQDVYEVDADYALGDNASLYASFKAVRDNFDNETYGLDSRDSEVSNIGVSWSPLKTLSLSAYGSHEEYEIRQIGRQMGATVTPFSEWELVSEDDADAFGVTMDWNVVEDRFDLSADLAYLDSESTYVSSELVNAGVTLVTGATPDSTDELLRLNLVGTYTFSDHVDISGRYIWEKREAQDWGWDTLLSTAAATTASTIGFAYQRPDYDSQAFILSARYKF